MAFCSTRFDWCGLGYLEKKTESCSVLSGIKIGRWEKKMFEVALLIIAIAFAVLVGVFIPLGVKLYKTVDVVNETIDETKQTIKVLTSDVNVTLHQTNEILAKVNVLVEDVNGKVSTIDPLFVAVAELSETVSDLNAQARNITQKATQASANVSKAGAAFAVGKVASKLFRKKGEEA